MCIFVFLFVRPVCVFSSSCLSSQYVDFRPPTCKVGVCIFVFLFLKSVCVFSFSYL